MWFVKYISHSDYGCAHDCERSRWIGPRHARIVNKLKVNYISFRSPICSRRMAFMLACYCRRSLPWFFSTVFVAFIIFIFASSVPPADVLGAQAVDFRFKPTVRCGRSQLCATSLFHSSSPSSPAPYSVSQCAGRILFSRVAKYRVVNFIIFIFLQVFQLLFLVLKL